MGFGFDIWAEIPVFMAVAHVGGLIGSDVEWYVRVKE